MNKKITSESDEIAQVMCELSSLKKHNAELSQAGFELVNTQSKLQSLLHNASDGIISFAADGTVETFNIAAQHIFGYSESEIITRKIPDLIPCSDWVNDNVGAYIRYFINSRASSNIPLLGKHRMGFDILLHVSTGQASNQDTVFFDDDTNNEADPFTNEDEIENQTIICFFRDITLDKKLEKELADHKHTLDLAAGVFIRDNDFRVIDVNDHFCQILGRNRNEFIGEQCIHLKFSGIPNNELQLQHRAEFLALGNSWSGESCFLNKQKQQIWFTESTTPFLDKNGIPYQYLSILIDITDRKYFESQLQQHRDHLQDLVDEQVTDLRRARDAAEIANASKSDFLANMSHELRTPMHGILSFTQLCLKQFKTNTLDEKQTKKVHKFLSNIQTSSHRLLALVNDLLDLSKLESGKENFYFEKQDLHLLLKQIFIENKAKLQEQKTRLQINKPTIPVIVSCDKSKILKVLSNLIGNAIKFSPTNSTIEVNFEKYQTIPGRRATDSTQVDCVLLSIADQGIGIPKNELHTIFDKFIQSSKTKSGAGGTGLGLSISHEVIKAHKGKIWAENNPKGGAILKFYLPAL
ncbi:MAG: PAS domain-containing sensor histidine kinase [Methylococcales bacterium]|nr:PAS domain-containing sensor histidine kinase [Methylococcales bacterium]